MNIDWQKCNGLIPAVIQDDITHQILMLGYMNQEALDITNQTKNVTFFSRTKHKLWTKGETSGHFLKLISMHIDCDQDTILCRVNPIGPTCHTGTISCFKTDSVDDISILRVLSVLLAERNKSRPSGSYTTSLFESGLSRISQKIGEEGVELALAHMKQDKQEITNECADLFYHAMVLLENSGLSLNDVCKTLKERHNAS
jgi:phosphoribosyl-AMP cyclohydrolase / phosphoribosyl-ATP pyrophosphohydrolase